MPRRSRATCGLAFVLLLLCTSSVHASFEDGVKAAKLRQYQEAFELLLPEAQAGNATAQLYIANMCRRGYGGRYGRLSQIMTCTSGADTTPAHIYNCN